MKEIIDIQIRCICSALDSCLVEQGQQWPIVSNDMNGMEGEEYPFDLNYYICHSEDEAQLGPLLRMVLRIYSGCSWELL